MEELRMIVTHLIEREYNNDIDQQKSFVDQVIDLAVLFRQRLTELVANWLRVGYCQGNFNSDNCAAGGFTLDYGPFGFCEKFDAEFQPWTGGGLHFSFFNQPTAAQENFNMFLSSLQHLLVDDAEALKRLDQVRIGFVEQMEDRIKKMWANKLGLVEFNQKIFARLLELIIHTGVDYTIFFRELSHIPVDISSLKKSFYAKTSDSLDDQWQAWLDSWRDEVNKSGDLSVISDNMKLVNPKYTWREWLIVPAYEQAHQGDYTLIKELQEVLCSPYDEQSKGVEEKYYRLKPKEFFDAGGVSHYSCSS
jgi:uncharacterized protein YdiU (UPF0061 family)